MELLITFLIVVLGALGYRSLGAERRAKEALERADQERARRKEVESVRDRYERTLLRLDVWLRQLMMSSKDEQSFFAMATAGVLDLVEADLAALPLLADGGEHHTLAAVAGENAQALGNQQNPNNPNGAFAWVLANEDALVIDDLSTSALALPAELTQSSASTALLAPVHLEGRTVGALIALKSKGHFDDVDRQLLVVYSQKVSVAMDNLRLVESLQEAKERAQVTLHSIGDAVITTDSNGLVEYMNPVAEQLTGWSLPEAQGMAVDDVFHVIHETQRDRVESPVTRCLAQGRIVGIPPHSALIRRDGKEFAIDDSAAPIRDSDGWIVGAVLVFHDVSRARAMARQLTWQARHDSLTGLANRRQFEDDARAALDDARAQNVIHTLLYLDLDQFKIVNDTCGHPAGDELLRQLTAQLRSKVRDTDTLARLGGDEFGVLLVQCPADVGHRIADKLREIVRSFRFVWDNRTFELGVSIGLVAITPQSANLSSLLSAADMACYMAKEQGRNRVHVYTEGDQSIVKRQGEMQWVSRITRALSDDRFVLYSQAIRPTLPSAPHGEHVEILVRMIDEEGAIVPPGAFIPAAERYNIMGDIDRWVVRNVLRRFDGLLRRPSEGEEPTMCAVNLSGASMSDERLLEFIRQELSAVDVPAECICFEITETAAVQNLATASQFIQELKDLGCRFALDDFGSGLSSFMYLKHLPVDFLKIDGSFVRDMQDNAMNRAIVEACHQIGRTIGVRTIAEFVEDRSTLDALHAIGVDFAQGYGISKPRPLDDFLAENARN